MNFAKGILETRKQTYRHLKSLLKTIPLETPTTIELSPGNELRVTLFDANHCIGSVMFLIEGDGKAVLYTGDIRSETWLVNSLVRNPVLIPYATGLKKLDTIYLDTTFASKENPNRTFPSKAQGIGELLQKVQKYPTGTLFFIESWTFGYEDVWVALSALLQSPIHLDPYRWGLYRSLANTTNGSPECPEAKQLCGFRLGNHHKEGCLTQDASVRIHSCERGGGCRILENDDDAVRIVPIVTRLEGDIEVQEMGIGGGRGDLDQVHELDVQDVAALVSLLALCGTRIKDDGLRAYVSTLLVSSHRSRRGRMLLDRAMTGKDFEADSPDMKLDRLVDRLVEFATRKDDVESHTMTNFVAPDKILPRTITFPYSRHSSYSELCELVAAFCPKDVYPCTVDEDNWTADRSMRMLFGHLCSGDVFAHDEEMMRRDDHRTATVEESQTTIRTRSTQIESTTESQPSQYFSFIPNPPAQRPITPPRKAKVAVSTGAIPSSSRSSTRASSPTDVEMPADVAVPRRSRLKRGHVSSEPDQHRDAASPSKRAAKSTREWAYEAAAGLNEDCGTWDAFGGLDCVKETRRSLELGNESEEL
jgi:DNA cross-link repair 1C protein